VVAHPPGYGDAILAVGEEAKHSEGRVDSAALPVEYCGYRAHERRVSSLDLLNSTQANDVATILCHTRGLTPRQPDVFAAVVYMASASAPTTGRDPDV